MALNALVDSFLPQSEKVWDWKGYTTSRPSTAAESSNADLPAQCL